MLQLAKLHARWWNAPRLTEFPWLVTPGDRAEAEQRIAVQAWQRASVAVGDRIDADAAAVIQAMVDRWPAIAAHLSGSPYTLTHGDFRLDNLCFPDGPLGQVVAFDWQVTRRGLGAIDLAYFLGSVDTSADSEGDTPRLIARYHEALVSHGVRDYSLEQLTYDHRVASCRGIWVANFALGLLDMSSERGRQLMERALLRVGSMARRLDLVKLLESDF